VESLNVSVGSSGRPRGFICMIFRDLVGGGGRAKASFAGACAIEDLRRIFTTSLAGMAGDFGDVGWYEDADEDFVEALEGLDSIPATAGGGSSNDICKAENCDPSLLRISVEEAGVGGCSGRGIVCDESFGD